METKPMYVYFIEVDLSKAKSYYNCHSTSNNTLMGTVIYSISKKQYCYYPRNETDYSIMHSNDISTFMYKLNNQ